MKRMIAAICILIAISLLVGCTTSPMFHSYGETVHAAVGKFYDDYEILELVHLRIDGHQSAYNLCIVDDKCGGIDIVCIAYVADRDDPGNVYTVQSVTVDNARADVFYTTVDAFDGVIAEFVICKREDVPESTKQKTAFRFNGEKLYLCVTDVSLKEVSQ